MREEARPGMRIDYLTGLEGGLIEDLQPDWNTFNAAGRARRSRIDLAAARDGE
jgi:hypothetical protein